MKDGRAQGFLTITLHAHLPYVVHHGTWPHGLEWLLEAAAETYLPLLRVLRNLERDGLALKANINLSPVLLEQLAHPVFRAEFPEYLKRKIQATREDEAYFLQSGDEHFRKTAQYWRRFFEQAAEDFETLGGDIVAGFRYFHDAGFIEVVTSCATHGYLPLLGTDESVVAQVRIGVATHRRHLGTEPRGIWVPECGYRPAGMWEPPVGDHRSAFWRIGVDEALVEAGLGYFFIDTHQVEQSVPLPSCDSNMPGGAVGTPAAISRPVNATDALYRAYLLDGPQAPQHPLAMFPRDPVTGLQVWSGDQGYPADPNYLEFHKKRWPGGHRYWQVTQSRTDMALKTPYYPERAAERVRAHAEHFVSLVYKALEHRLNADHPPVLSSPFDAELLGHWWFEGPSWLEQVARIVAQDEFPIALTSGSAYLDRYPPDESLAIAEGSWGKNGTNEVWLNPETEWTWSHIYAAEEKVRAIATEGKWRCGGAQAARQSEPALGACAGGRIVKQMCRELLLMESSDWQFLITTEAARDYAEKRFLTHLDQFRELEKAWEEFTEKRSLSAENEEQLAAIEARDNIFPDVDPGLWVKR